MADRCVRAHCSIRFKDNAKSKSKSSRNISSPEYSWLLKLLMSDGVDSSHLSGMSEKICYKCFKKYDRHKDGQEAEPGNATENDVNTGNDNSASNTDATIVDGTNTCNYDKMLAGEVDDTDKDVKPMSASNHLPVLTVDELFNGSASHRKCTICLYYSDAGLIPLPKLAKRQLIFSLL